MPKKIRFESFVYRFLAQANTAHESLPVARKDAWRRFVGGLRFTYEDGSAVVRWAGGGTESVVFSLADADFYRRGDTAAYVERQREQQLVGRNDLVQQGNAQYFQDALRTVCARAGVELS